MDIGKLCLSYSRRMRSFISAFGFYQIPLTKVPLQHQYSDTPLPGLTTSRTLGSAAHHLTQLSSLTNLPHVAFTLSFFTELRSEEKLRRQYSKYSVEDWWRKAVDTLKMSLLTQGVYWGKRLFPVGSNWERFYGRKDTNTHNVYMC